MAEDRSLDEFADDAAEDAESNDRPANDGTQAADGEGVDDGEQGEASEGVNNGKPVDEGSEPPLDPGETDPATSTSAWTTGGAACDRCGERVTRRWADDDDLVCPDCKTW
ncbi:DUF7573 domain-containing protein [Halorubrum tibetense]|uniref:DUF7573 domain-containing protein n=1 Tax=Halorubrum tibetense TaxID=175631 RepID=A0ABD5SAZ9_9EURY